MNRLRVKEIDRDRFMRTAECTIGVRSLVYPSFSPLLRTEVPNEVEILFSTKRRFPLQHVDTAVVRVFDAESLLAPQLDKERNLTLEGTPVRGNLSAFLEQNLLIPDPATEYLYFEDYYTRFMRKSMPRPVREYAASCAAKKKGMKLADFNLAKRRWHEKFWLDMHSSLRTLNQLVGEFMDLEQKFFPIQVPPSPLIIDGELLEIAKQVNRLSRAISESRDRECTTYLPLHAEAVHDSQILEEILEYIEHDNAPLTILKIKNLDLTGLREFDGRENYRNLLARLVDIKSNNPRRAFMLLEAANQFWVSWQAFDSMSGSLTGMDVDVHYGKDRFGYWWDPIQLVPRKHSDFVRKYTNEGSRFGTHCPPCASIVGNVPEADQYHTYRREHRLHDMDQKADTISRAIGNKTSGVLFNTVLYNSALSSLHDCLLN